MKMSSEILSNKNVTSTATLLLRVGTNDIPPLLKSSSTNESNSYTTVHGNIVLDKRKSESESFPEDLENNFCRESTASSSSASSSSPENIIYQVPKSRDCNAAPKENASLFIDSLIPEAAKLILAQGPKNRIDLLDQDRSDTESPLYASFHETENGLNSSSSFENEDDTNSGHDFIEDTPYVDVDYGLQVILEETASQMESDSDQELNRPTDGSSEDTVKGWKSKNNSDSLSKLDLLPGYTSSWLQTVTTTSPDDNEELTDHNSLPDEIIVKHIRVPSDWDPEILLKRIYTVHEPTSNNSKTGQNTTFTQDMEGHMLILSGHRRKGTFWNAWKRKFCVSNSGKLLCYEKDDCQNEFQSINLIGGKVDFLDPVEFVGPEKGKALINRILGIDDGKGHYYVFQCGSLGEASRWIETLQQQTAVPKAFAIPALPKNIAIFRDILLVDFGATNTRAGILSHQPILPALFFSSVMSENEETGRIIYGNDVYLTANRKKAKIKFPFECSSKMCQNTVDLGALKGFMKKIYSDLNISPNNYRLILTLPRMIDKKCRQSILKLLFNEFEVRSVLMCHQSVISFWAHSTENGIIVDIGERCDVVPVSQGFVLSQAWGRAPFGGHVLKHALRQGLGPQENGLYLSTPVENLVLRYISENFVSVQNGHGPGVRRLSQDSQEIVVEMDLRDILPFSNLIGVNQEVLRGVAEGFFDPGIYGLDCESLQNILSKTIIDSGIDIRKEMSRNIFLVGGCTQIPGFPERLELELTKLLPPYLKPSIQVSPYRYHSSFIGASVLAGTEAYEQSLLKRVDYDGGTGPLHWLV